MPLPCSCPTPLMLLASCIVVSGAAIAPLAAGEQQGDTPKTRQVGSIDQRTSDALPKNKIPQNSPCADQPKSLLQLRRAFDRGRFPTPSETTGSWVAIGFFGDDVTDLNCGGLRRVSMFEEVMLVTGYSVETHVIGTVDQTPTMAPDHAGNLVFPFDFGGDARPVYRCRLTTQKTLACLIDVYRQGVEFKKMSVNEDDIYSSR